MKFFIKVLNISATLFFLTNLINAIQFVLLWTPICVLPHVPVGSLSAHPHLLICIYAVITILGALLSGWLYSIIADLAISTLKFFQKIATPQDILTYASISVAIAVITIIVINRHDPNNILLLSAASLSNHLATLFYLYYTCHKRNYVGFHLYLCPTALDDFTRKALELTPTND